MAIEAFSLNETVT